MKVPMMLKTGRKGFTLVEVMVAAAVLALGVVMIYEAYFISLDTFNYWYNYLNVSCWLDNKIWEAQDRIRRLGALSAGESAGDFTRLGKTYNWAVSSDSIDADSGLYEVTLCLSWKEGKRQRRAIRTGAAVYNVKQKQS